MEEYEEKLKASKLQNMPTPPQHFRDITEKMAEIYEAKNHDYGNSFGQSLDKYGLIAAIVRMEDKMNRLSTLCAKNSLVSVESIIDTLTDLANYAVMTRMWLEERNVK